METQVGRTRQSPGPGVRFCQNRRRRISLGASGPGKIWESQRKWPTMKSGGYVSRPEPDQSTGALGMRHGHERRLSQLESTGRPLHPPLKLQHGGPASRMGWAFLGPRIRKVSLKQNHCKVDHRSV